MRRSQPPIPNGERAASAKDQADFNEEGKLGSGKEMQDRLSTLVAIFDGLDFRAKGRRPIRRPSHGHRRRDRRARSPSLQRAVKQGMMQQLLTGRVRLVDPELPGATE